MSYGSPQPASGSNGTLVLITLGVCVASFLELFAVIGGYVLIVGGLFFSRVANDFQAQQARNANQQSQEVAQRQAELQRQTSPSRNTPPRPSPSMPPPRSQSTRTAPASPPADLIVAPFNSRVPPQDVFDRDWKDRTGKVIFRGHLYANYGPAVRLINGSPAGGSYRSIPLATATLSDEDQQYVKRFPVRSTTQEDSEDRGERIRREAEENRKRIEQRMQEQRELMERNRPPMPPVSPPTSTSPPSTPPTSPPAANDPLQGMRSWSDSTGRFKLEAELIGVENGSVQLRRPDGKIVTMAIDKLSTADRDLVRAKYPQP